MKHMIEKILNALMSRSEERRVGKECRSGGSPEHQKKKKERSAAGHVLTLDVIDGQNCLHAHGLTRIHARGQ